MSWPAPARHHHQAFCRQEGWQQVRDARGRTGTHHITYELHLKDGRILRTRVSHPPDRSTHGPALWRHILRDQLDLSEDEFWACVRTGAKPDRGEPASPAEALPGEVVHLLITRVGLTEGEVAAMSRDQALARLQRYWTEDT